MPPSRETEPEAAGIPCPLRASALSTPDAPAITGATGATAYAEFDGRVSAAAERLAYRGCAPGARVALRLEKDERYVALLLAVLRAGCVACPVSTRVPPEGVAAYLRVAGPSVLISDLPSARVTGVPVIGPEELVPEASEVARPEGHLYVPPNQPATVVFTSGSTGTPKAALHTFGNHYYSALGSGKNIPLGSGDRWLQSLPLYHVGGLSIVFRCLLAGATMSLPGAGLSLGESIARSGATHVSLVATQLRRLLSEDAPLGTLGAILLGGGPVPETLVDEALERGLPIHTSYGLTETSSQATATPPRATRKALRTSGRALPYREVSVAEDGEILVRGETLFAGYVEGDDLDPRLDEAGWFHTKDLGELDGDGYLRVRGRKDNRFVSGGENVQPEEIEEALHRIEGVEQAVVVPVPNEEFGERPVAFVRARDGRTLEDLARALEAVLPRFKIPVAFHPWPEPSGPEGMKVERAGFRELARRLEAPPTTPDA